MSEQVHAVSTTISALRVYMKRGDNKESAHWWSRMFEKPLSHYLVNAALEAGLMHAAVNLGHIGFSKDATSVAYDSSEIPLSTMPVCVELLGPKRLLEQFIRVQAKHLVATTMVMVDGIHISSLYLSELDKAIDARPHHVEYISGSNVPLSVDHVELDTTEKS
jgi:PII-like signaling protein